MNLDEQQRRRGRLTFLALAILFLGPLAVAMVSYYTGYRPGSGSTNLGNLVNPPRPLSEQAMITLTGDELSADWLLGTWTLLYLSNSGCDAECEAAMYAMRQVRVALGKNMQRVQRALVVLDGNADHAHLDAEYQGTLLLRGDGAGGQALLDGFPDPAGAAGKIYVVDPLGNLMMWYQASDEPRHLLKDLKKLLRLSRVG